MSGEDDEGTEEESEHVKEVYAHFGLAIYLSNVLEHALVNILYELKLIPDFHSRFKGQRKTPTKEDWFKAFDRFSQEQFAQTMGTLIATLRKMHQVPDYIEGALDYANERRIFLAHAFFRDRAVEFMTTDGREKMLAELKKDQKLFQDMEEIVMSLSKKASK